ARQKIHPFQYLMVGAALCLFYLLLLSISEFIGFSWAYLIAAVASTLLITWYCRFFLGGGVRTFMIGAGLAGVFFFFFFISLCGSRITRFSWAQSRCLSCWQS